MTESTTVNQSVFSLDVHDDGIAVMVIDDRSASVNTLKQSFVEEITQLLDEVENSAAIKGLIIISGKADCFVAGADIEMLAHCDSAKEAESLARAGQAIFQRLENMVKPVVAAIHGSALGGGLELALACHYRVCTDAPITKLGLPEVQLGLLPGSGGTQRLPRLIGLQHALKMMLTGSAIDAKRALKNGLVNHVVPPDILLQTAKEVCQKSRKSNLKKKQGVVDRLLEGNKFGRKIVLDKARQQTLAKTQGNYPAPLFILDAVAAGFEQSRERGYQVEAELFGRLVMSPESVQLRNIFFATTAMKKESFGDEKTSTRVNHVSVLGGGLMGGGIAYVTANKAELPVRIKDISTQGIANALKYSYDLLNKKRKKGFIKQHELDSVMSRISGNLDFSGMGNTDIVIEAVFEDLALKQKMVAEVEQYTTENTIFASNTSSIPISQIAEKAIRPENIIGLHYFSPVDKMPLAEIIAHAKTSPDTIAKTVGLARKQGKTPIVVKDGAGFYVNRILAPYINAAANLILAGEPIDKIDRALVKFGFPVGPIKLLDEVGIDVGTKIIPILVDQFGERFNPPVAFEKVLNDDRKGKKNSKGFYDYSGKKPGKNVDESIYTLLGVVKRDQLSEQQIVDRCLLLMLNEAARCLEEGVIKNARDGDIGAIFGIGYPPFLGGPFRYMDSLGVNNVVAKMEALARDVSENYRPCQTLIDKANSGEKFYE